METHVGDGCYYNVNDGISRDCYHLSDTVMVCVFHGRNDVHDVDLYFEVVRFHLNPSRDVTCYAVR